MLVLACIAVIHVALKLLHFAALRGHNRISCSGFWFSRFPVVVFQRPLLRDLAKEPRFETMASSLRIHPPVVRNIASHHTSARAAFTSELCWAEISFVPCRSSVVFKKNPLRSVFPRWHSSTTVCCALCPLHSLIDNAWCHALLGAVPRACW